MDDLSVELNRVMQIVTTTADLDVNLQKECFLLQDMHSICERVVNSLITHDIEIQDEEDLFDIYGDLVTAQKSYGELKKTLEAIEELKSIKSLMDLAGDELYAYKSDLSQQCAKFAGIIKGDFVKLPDKLIDDMTVMMSRLLRAKPEPASPVISGPVDPSLTLP